MKTDASTIFLQRLEGGAFALIALWLYSFSGESWWWFLLFILAPYLSMLAYSAGPRLGSAVYNLVHTWVAPVLLWAVAWYANASFLIALAFIWAAHIGIDRGLGYGLKLQSGFRDTHLGPIGGDS